MPSPYVGMDPFLEDPAVFPDLHDSLIFCLGEAINVQLPEPYYTGIASRVWVEIGNRLVGPDVDVLHPEAPESRTGLVGSGGLAVVEAEPVATEPVVIHVPSDEVRETFLEIYAQPGRERLITNIEILSLSNKTPGDQGRDLYLRKQREVLNSQVHLVEIDLLRAGVHSTAVPLQSLRARVPTFDYHVCVHRIDKLDYYFVYPIGLGVRLPVVSVPLLPGDAPVRVDLQAVLDRCYDSRQYRRRIRYGDQSPIPPLRPEQAERVERGLRETVSQALPPEGNLPGQKGAKRLTRRRREKK